MFEGTNGFHKEPFQKTLLGMQEIIDIPKNMQIIMVLQLVDYRIEMHQNSAMVRVGQVFRKPKIC